MAPASGAGQAHVSRVMRTTIMSRTRLVATLGAWFMVGGAVGPTPAAGHPASTPCQEACLEAALASSCPRDPATIPDQVTEAETAKEKISDFQLVILSG